MKFPPLTSVVYPVCRGWTAALVYLLAGCTVGPKYQGPPTTQSPGKFKNAYVQTNSGEAGRWKIAEPEDGADRAAWWSVFHDPTLDALETEAVNANQKLQAAVARIAQAAVARIAQTRAQTRVAAADFFPGVQARPDYVRQRTSNTEPIQRAALVGQQPGPLGVGTGTGTGVGAGSDGGQQAFSSQPLSRTYNVFSFPFDLNWEVDLFGRVRRNTEAARANAQSLQADLENMRLSITANVAANYFNLHALDAEIEVLERTIKTRTEALQISQERLEYGVTGELDVVRARSDLAGNKADVYSVQRSRGEMENALAILLGREASDFHVARRSPQTLPPRIPAGLPGQLLERRPDVASAERSLAAANARIGVATAAFFPTVRLTGAAGFESADLGHLFQWQSSLWQIGPSVTLPIFQGGRNFANLRDARARYDEEVARYRQQVLGAFREVENALVDLHTLGGQAEEQARAADAARRALRLSQEQYGKGAASFLDVLDAQRTLLLDERTNAQLLGHRSQATVQLIKALGGRWE